MYVDEEVDEDIPTSLLPPSLQAEDDPAVKLKSNEVRIGPMTRARMKRNQASHEEEEQLDRKMDVKLDMELDMKTSHGSAREEREECARGEDEVQAGARSGPTGRAAGPSGPRPVRPDPTGHGACANRALSSKQELRRSQVRFEPDRRSRPVDGPGRQSSLDAKLVNQKDKDAADLMTWRDFEALRNEMRREFRIEDDELRGTQQRDEDLDEVPGRGDRPRGWAPLGRHGRGQDEEDGLGKPKFSIPKFEGGADVEEYLTWELKIEKLWSLHPNYTEDRKIKLASSEFDGYALRWWDALVGNRQADGELPIITWRAMKEAMNSRFMPTNYLRTIFDKLTLLRQGVKTMDEYYMEMEQRGRVRESLEMTMQCFLNGLNWLKKQRLRDVLQELDVSRLARPLRARQLCSYSTPSSKPGSNVSTKEVRICCKWSGSSMSTARNRDMVCHTCGGKGHFKRDCPNRKVMIINEDNEYETGDDVDPNAPDDDDYDTDGEDAYPSDARTIVVSQRALNVLPSASTQRCNLFQTKALVGPDKACKVIIDGGSCRNLASKELCTKLKLKYVLHPHPYYIQWLSDNGEIKVNHMVRVEFEIGPYKDCIDFDVVPMTVCHLLLGRPWFYDRSMQHNGRANTYHLEYKGKKINL
ncbi:hypothetical protein QYE76_003971 [Lolium multiflorum]|uniref:CCHC-type domain-containing protein n=1 Tax=Lolium multiflorum TaxID=4521 RepID=A0AAD8W223_LOLMU|nr:hypothetical protein QYE76_003971 [Lolium multiflorum]